MNPKALKKFGLLTAMLVASLLLSSCDDLQKRNASVSAKLRNEKRFELIHNGTFTRTDIAFDTRTGRVCRTWEWVSSNRDNVDPLETVITCERLAKMEE